MEELYGQLNLLGIVEEADPRHARLYTDNGGNTQRYAESAELIAAYCGHPRWSDGRLSALAQERGFARSLLDAFRDHGKELLQSLQGDFAIVVVNRREPTGVLAIDRMGICNLNYALISGRTLYFGTHLARLFASKEVTDDIDPQALFNYVYFHVVPSPRTIYRDIRKLEPGQCVSLDGGTANVLTYWHPTFTPPTAAPDKAALMHETRESIEQSVRRCDTDEHTGTFLSGGLDSSTVAGMFRRVRDTPVPTFSIGFQEDGYDELPYARIAARHFGTISHEHYVTIEDIEKAVPLIASHFEEPFGNSSAIPTYICARFARENGMTALLAGDGGDELFAGNARYAKQAMFELYGWLPPGMRTSLLEPWLVLRKHPQKLWPMRKLQRYIEQAMVPLPARLESNNLLNKMPLENVFDHSLLAETDTTEPLRELGRRYHAEEVASSLDRMLFLDWKFTLADNDLRKVNTACAAAGVEVRYPMLDEAVVNTSMRIPASEKLRRFKLRSFYKSTFKDFLPKEIINKRKHGFGLPFGQWLKASPRLSDLVDDTLTDLRKRGLFAEAFIEQVRSSHRDEHAGYYGTTLWVLFMLEQWWQRQAK